MLMMVYVTIKKDLSCSISMFLHWNLKKCANKLVMNDMLYFFFFFKSLNIYCSHYGSPLLPGKTLDLKGQIPRYSL